MRYSYIPLPTCPITNDYTVDTSKKKNQVVRIRSGSSLTLNLKFSAPLYGARLHIAQSEPIVLMDSTIEIIDEFNARLTVPKEITAQLSPHAKSIIKLGVEFEESETKHFNNLYIEVV